MYGKTLENDFPERFDEFEDEFIDADPTRLGEAFRAARGVCAEFPTPADVRKIYDRIPASPERIEAAHERLRQRIAAQPEPKMLPSALDGQLKLRHGLSDEEVKRRVAILKKRIPGPQP